MPRQLELLDAEIARAEVVHEREYLKGRRAALLARHGRFAEARFALAGLRSRPSACGGRSWQPGSAWSTA